MAAYQCGGRCRRPDSQFRPYRQIRRSLPQQLFHLPWLCPFSIIDSRRAIDLAIGGSGDARQLLSRKIHRIPRLARPSGLLQRLTGKGARLLIRTKFRNRSWTSISNDCAVNCDDFLEKRPAGKPFLFWYGSHEPHSSFRAGADAAAGMKVSALLPDKPEVRSEILDYLRCADNGMPLPRAKANVQEYGIHLPTALSWPKAIPAGVSFRRCGRNRAAGLTHFAPLLRQGARVTSMRDETTWATPVARSARNAIATSETSPRPCGRPAIRRISPISTTGRARTLTSPTRTSIRILCCQASGG